MTPQLTSQIVTLLMQLFQLVILPLLAYYAVQMVRQDTSRIKDQRIRAFADTLVRQAEALIPASTSGNAQRFSVVAAALHDKFPFIPQEEIAAVIEAAVLDLHQQLGTFTPPVAAPAAPSPVNAPAPAEARVTAPTPIS